MKHSPVDRRRRSLLKTLGVGAVALKLAPAALLADEHKKLKLYWWETYTGPDTLGGFHERTGVTASMDFFSDNDELYATIAAGDHDYDLIVPSGKTVNRLIRGRLLQPLDRDRIPNAANLDPTFLQASFDPGRRFSLPYMWGTIGIGYRKSRVKGVPDSWRWLYDSTEYSGRIALLADDEATIQLAMKYLGYSVNSINAKRIAEAVALIVRQKEHLALFADDDGQTRLKNGEVDLVQEWSGDITQVMAKDDDIGYVVPREGSLLWQDSVCIPAGAENVDSAHAFINYLLEAEVGADIARAIGYATPNLAAKALLPASYTDDPAIYPSEDTLSRCEVAEYRGELIEKRYRDGWARIHAA